MVQSQLLSLYKGIMKANKNKLLIIDTQYGASAIRGQLSPQHA